MTLTVLERWWYSGEMQTCTFRQAILQCRVSKCLFKVCSSVFYKQTWNQNCFVVLTTVHKDLFPRSNFSQCWTTIVMTSSAILVLKLLKCYNEFKELTEHELKEDQGSRKPFVHIVCTFLVFCTLYIRCTLYSVHANFDAYLNFKFKIRKPPHPVSPL